MIERKEKINSQNITTPTISKSSASFLFGNKIMGAFGFFLLNLSFSAARDQGYIVIINAMKGLEHVFVFIFSLFLTVFYPKILHEKFDYHTIVLKIIGIAFIGLGFVFIVWFFLKKEKYYLF